MLSEKKNLKTFENKKKKKKNLKSTMNLNFPGFRVERQILMQLGNSARANRGEKDQYKFGQIEIFLWYLFFFLVLS
jgi:hypothetical protein